MRGLVISAALLAALVGVGCTHPGTMGPGQRTGMMGPGYGPGMMGPGYGAGPGMMMGAPGMMMGLERLDLSPEQRSRIARIQDEARQQHQAWMQAMHAPGGPMAGMMGGASTDEAATRQAYEAMAAGHKQMFEAHLQTRQRILEVLTPAQREQLGRSWHGGRTAP